MIEPKRRIINFGGSEHNLSNCHINSSGKMLVGLKKDYKEDDKAHVICKIGDCTMDENKTLIISHFKMCKTCVSIKKQQQRQAIVLCAENWTQKLYCTSIYYPCKIVWNEGAAINPTRITVTTA